MTENRDPSIVNQVDTGPLMSRSLPIRFVEEGDNRLVIETVFTDEHLNRAGSVHGGFLAAFADIGCTGGAGVAAGGLHENFGITISLTTNYLAAACAGVARCEAECVGGGRRTKTVEGRIFDSSGTLVALATAAVKVVDAPA